MLRETKVTRKGLHGIHGLDHSLHHWQAEEPVGVACVVVEVPPGVGDQAIWQLVATQTLAPALAGLGSKGNALVGNGKDSHTNSLRVNAEQLSEVRSFAVD